MDLNSINPLELAYIGDAVYEVIIRNYLIQKGIRKVNNLQIEAKKYVSAKGQSAILNTLMETEVLTSEEKEIVKRARNYKSISKPKHTDILTYKYATGFEALIGQLYLEKNYERINEIIKLVLEEK